jgi:MFS family permease
MSDPTAIPTRPHRQPAWLLLGGAFSTFTIGAALMHSYTVYLVAFIEEFGWSRAETSVAYSVSQLVAGGSSPFVGALVDRLGPRRLLLLGGALLVLGLIGSAFVTALWQVIVLYGVVMTIGANCLGLVVFVPILSRHFVRRRGMAISIVQSANGFGRAVSAPLVQLGVSGIGWRPTYLVQAALMALLVLPLAALFRRTDPVAPASGDGTVPAGNSTAGPAAAPRPGWTLGDAARTPHFWLLFAVYLFTGLGSFFVSLHQLAFAIDIGFDRVYAAEVLGMGALLAVFGTIVTGDPRLWDLDRRGDLRPPHHQPRPASAVMAARLLFRADLGGARPGDHRQDRRSVPRPPARNDPRGHHDRQRDRRRRRRVGRRLDL